MVHIEKNLKKNYQEKDLVSYSFQTHNINHSPHAVKKKKKKIPTKVHLVKVVVFPAVMYRFEGWTIKKAGH